MEELFVYLLKSSALIAAFFLSYHFLLRKETFFTSNRWFLLTGLLTSVLLPLFFITKTVWIERPKAIPQNLDLVPYESPTPIKIEHIQVAEPFDWVQFVAIAYAIIASLLVLKIVFNFVMLYRMLHHQKVVRTAQFKLVDFNNNHAPFSFFNYIVYNSDLYSDQELQSILSHEKIHSREKHSVDVLIAEIFCSLFWFNPFIWLYKKAILQNLEYIADHKAIEKSDDKKSYQHALLKVVSHQNCLPITNNFYQSLIKKRIIMLNKNQSRKRNAAKYTIVIPALIAFVFLFQVKVEAKEKELLTPAAARFTNVNSIQNAVIAVSDVNENKGINAAYVYDKISSDKEIKSNVDELKKEYNIDLKISNLKRNTDGEIISIKMSFNDNKGNKGTTQQDRTIPIRPIFFKAETKEGKYTIGFYDNPEMVQKEFDAVNEAKITAIEAIPNDALIYVDQERYIKEELNELDPKGLERIEVLKDAESLKKYAAADKGVVYIITTNWPAREQNIAFRQQASPTIFTLANGDEVVIINKFSMKIPGYPMVTFTDKSPVLVFNGMDQKNPRYTLEKIDLTKIKTIKVLNANNEEVKGAPIHKMIISTK